MVPGVKPVSAKVVETVEPEATNAVDGEVVDPEEIVVLEQVLPAEAQ